MKANNAVRAFVSAGAGALFWLTLTNQGFPTTAEHIPAKVEEKVVLIAHKSEPLKRHQTERFDTPPPILRVPEKENNIVNMASIRQQKLKAEGIEIAKQEVIERKKQALKRVAVEKAKKEKARKERIAKQKAAEKAKKERIAKKAAEKKRRESLRGVPVPGAVIGATFGIRGPWARYHTGLDFRAPYGTTVKAVAPGRIIYAGNKGNWAGNHVVIRHSDGKKTLYAHLSSISKTGGSVSAGTPIGRVGRSGRTFGAHLHLELYPSGAVPGDVYRAINPRPWLRSRGIQLG